MLLSLVYYKTEMGLFPIIFIVIRYFILELMNS